MKVQPLEFEKPIVELEKQLDELKKHSKPSSVDFEREVRAMEKKIEETKREIYGMLSAWQKVQIARHTARPFATATACLGTTRRCLADLRRSENTDAALLPTRREGIPRRTFEGISEAPIPRVTGRRSASCGWRKDFAFP